MMSTQKAMFYLALLSYFLYLNCSNSDNADLVLKNGKIATVDENFSIVEAVAVKDARIIFTGSNSEIGQFIGDNTEVVDLDGKLALPGLIDAHAHLHSLGNELANLDITGTTGFSQIIDIVAERVRSAEPGEWILGGRWDHNDWPDKKFPVHDALSRISPDNPVYLRRVDGNSAFANAKALEIAGITKDTPDPTGGVIHRKSNGEPSGVLINRAMNIVLEHIPPDSDEYFERKFLQAVESCLSVGLTGVHEAGIGDKAVRLYKKLIDEERLDLRLYAMLGDQENPEQEGDLVSFFRQRKIDNYGDHFLSVKSIKLFFDGALGSRGAAFFDPYTDDPDNNGLLRVTPDYIYRVSKAALEVGMGVNTHCIGVRGNRLCIDAYEKALLENPTEDHRFRIEHAQIVRDEDIQKFKELDIIPAMQPTHCTSDMYFVEDRVGHERAKGAYAWRSYIDAGMVIPSGSDFPVESNNPMLGIYAAVTRQDKEGYPEGGWFPEQRMTIEEAVKGFTIWAAYGAFQENILGSIEVGKLADFTVLDKDILTIQPIDILSAKTLYTIVGGKIRFRAR
ncbi:MAG: amidohydrolase [bacterium]|nr:amidohydrolase [bacterium]